jgi:hypothetical protein
MSIDIDKKVLDLMNKVKVKRAQIKELGRATWRTTCSLALPGMERFNIQVCGKNDLVIAAGILMNIESGCTAASKVLDIQHAPLWQNYPIDDWLADIKQRIKAMDINAEKKKLADMESKLETLTSPEQRRAMELEKLESELGE